MTRIKQYLTLLALVALWALPGPAHASQWFKEFYATTTGGTVSLYNYTKGDTTTITTDPIACKGARFIMVWISTRYENAVTGADSAYTDSLSNASCAISMDDTTFATLTFGGKRFGTIWDADGTTLASVRLGRRFNNDGVGWYVRPYNNSGASVANSNTVIPIRSFKIILTPINRNTPSGTVSTQGLRTKGFNGLTIKVVAYYENP